MALSAAAVRRFWSQQILWLSRESMLVCCRGSSRVWRSVNFKEKQLCCLVRSQLCVSYHRNQLPSTVSGEVTWGDSNWEFQERAMDIHVIITVFSLFCNNWLIVLIICTRILKSKHITLYVHLVISGVPIPLFGKGVFSP